MKIAKIINNNIVSAYDEKGRELVIMGRGLGFGKKTGDDIDAGNIEKIFKMDSQDEINKLQEILADIPIENIRLVNEIIEKAGIILEKRLNKSIYITLTDHVNFAIERYKRNIELTNPLAWDIKKIYPLEFQAGLEAVKLINEAKNINLPEDEAASVAIHFVNAELGMEIPNTMNITSIIQNSLKIIENEFKTQVNENSIHFERFVAHLQVFARRVVEGSILEDCDEELYEMVRKTYKKEFKCAKKIKDFLEKEFNADVPKEEITYITLYMRKLISDQNKIKK